MHNNYIINESIIFHPTTSTLRDCNIQGKVVELNSPAARCLLLLIKRSGEVVTQQEFMDAVWKKSGMTVTPNAYYHNISVLRKGLKSIGLGDDIIVTIPRIGLTLAAGTRIKMVMTETSPTISNVNHNMDISENMTKKNKMQEEQYNKNNSYPNSSDASIPANPLRLKWLSSFRMMTILALVVSLSALFFFISLSQKENYFSNFIPSISTKNCHILLSPLTFKGDEKKHALNYGNQYIDECQKLPWIYVTKLPNLPRASVIRCDKPFIQSSLCVSSYFIE